MAVFGRNSYHNLKSELVKTHKFRLCNGWMEQKIEEVQTAVQLAEEVMGITKETSIDTPQNQFVVGLSFVLADLLDGLEDHKAEIKYLREVYNKTDRKLWELEHARDGQVA